MTNDKRWQDNSDGWVKAMNASKAKKEAQRRVEGNCNHDDWSWCDTCAFDTNGERVAQKGIDY
jgi:hypothetical protein|tara:strand:+ start:458 stop:646 length:189 start_codon:yes stop_codon:yes gene_type:complete